MSVSNTTMKFDSAGFDLDDITAAIQQQQQQQQQSNSRTATAASSVDDIIVELHTDGTTTTTTPTTTTTSTTTTTAAAASIPNEDPILRAAEEWKQQANAHYQRKEYDVAYDQYTRAIQCIPGVTGTEIVQHKVQWENEQHIRLRQELRDRDAAQMATTTTATTTKTAKSSSSASNNTDHTHTNTTTNHPPVQFVVDPPHPYGTALAVYYCNRAATLLQLCSATNYESTNNANTNKNHDDDDDDDEYDDGSITQKKNKKPIHPKLQDALDDCTVAILFHPTYVKAYVRRSTIYERIDRTEEALQDMLQAQQLDPHYNRATIQKHVQRLQNIEQERMEVLKTETLSKLKDLGNSLLSNFGLSLDNFQAQKDPNTGSYNISFQQK
jgi:tetratricopeptide (TPR) repeat protein